MLIMCQVASSKISVIGNACLLIREDRKEQTKVVEYMEIDVGRIDLAPGLHSYFLN